jgi:hypothetical protein
MYNKIDEKRSVGGVIHIFCVAYSCGKALQALACSGREANRN